MSDRGTEKLREEVNPAFNTAKACLQVMAELGDADTRLLKEKMDIQDGMSAPAGEGMMPEMKEFVFQKLRPGFNIMIEARFSAANRLILESGFSRTVDLPCGYTSRGIRFSRENIRYFGMDLPVVIDAVAPAVRELIGVNERISYHAVDATNYTSLVRALTGEKEPGRQESIGRANSDPKEGLLITTEGMLMYLTQSELEQVFMHMRRLLLEFGGKWITMDNELVKGQNRILEVLMEGEDEAVRGQIARKTAGLFRVGNRFFDENEAEHFVGEMGLRVEKVPLFDYLPEQLHSLEQLSDEKKQAVREVFKKVNLWVMTPGEGTISERSCEEKNFSAQMACIDGTLEVALSGRVDTLTAPSLLALYRETTDGRDIRRIIIDMKNLDYISSAGLRVLLIMHKALDSGRRIQLIHLNENIRSILKTTGFEGVFG